MFESLRRFFSKDDPFARRLFASTEEMAENWEREEELTVHLDIPFSPFLGGGDDDFIKGLQGTDNLGQPVTTFPLGRTSAWIHFDFMNLTFHASFTTEEVTVEDMVAVCCGVLALKILPERDKFAVPKDLDFRRCRLLRISWNTSLHAWRPIFSFDGQEAKPAAPGGVNARRVISGKRILPPPPRPKLSLATLQSGTAEDAAVAAYFTALETFKLFADYDDAVRLLTRPWRAVYTTFWLKCEVDNGGHEQFFDNGRGALDQETQEDLAYIGAKPFLRYFIEARSFFDPDAQERDPRLSEIDDSFYGEPKTLHAYLGEFIRAHPEDYTT